ncbi:reticulophagy regulator 1 isoform X1 [Paramormyrops kingsleyae]|uniref:Reticulophagy regulator 1 n=1 Tax=Paramormyrops kingsleyae TaxID=1676925 RepID=A0A3B3S2Q3_9TELE|nr:reticulophagy regulator 1 [Paramormyrops kingsleyae]
MAIAGRRDGDDASEAGARVGAGGGGAGAMPTGKGDRSAGARQFRGGSLLSCIASVITWKRPLYTSLLFIATNAIFWLVALSSWRLYHLLTLCLMVLVTVQMMKDMVLARKRGASLWRSMTESWEVIDSGPDTRAGVGQLAESWVSVKLFLQELSSFKQQNPGKFCLLVCSLCTFLAILGRYIPGVIILYVGVSGIFLWPLLSSHEFGLWMEPVLQKLDFGVADFLQRIKENHEKRMLQRRDEISEADESALFPKLDSTVCKDMSVSDTEVSEVTWTDNGTFNLSEEHTPQTENSEELDRRSDVDEVFMGGLPEFPSLDNGVGTNGDEEELSIGLPNPSGESSQTALELVNRMAGDVIAATITAAIQERLEGVAGAPAARPRPPLDSVEDSDSEAEDFELLDQSELEQLESEPEAAESPGTPNKSFLSSLLRRQ